MKSRKDAARLEMPPEEKITLDWLIKHVPLKLWVSFGGLLLGAFLSGERVGPLSFVREIVSSIEQKEIQRVPSPTPAPSVPAAKIEIRSPISGAHVSGETTFAASLNDRPLSDYKMFWLVDNDHLNLMIDSNESEPHKEAKVDVTRWDWKKDGQPYVITFVATDLSDSRIAERSVNIFVDRK